MTTQNQQNGQQTALVPNNRQSALKALFEKSKPAFAQVVPKHFTADRVIKLVLAATSRQPELAECTQASLLQCSMTATALGLEPNTPLGHCYLVAYKNNKQQIMECTFQLGYKGFIELARRSGHVATIEACPVFENDFFDHCYGLAPRLEHRIALKDRGPLIAAYAIAQMRDGARQFRVLGRDDINAAKKASKTSSNPYGPWALHEPAMAAKSAIRRLGNQMPLSIEIRGTPMHIVTATDAAEAGTLIDSETVAELAPVDSLEERLSRQAGPEPTPPDLMHWEAAIAEATTAEELAAVLKRINAEVPRDAQGRDHLDRLYLSASQRLGR